MIVSLATDAVKKWNRRVLIVSHVKELIQQVSDSLEKWTDIRFGIFSSGIGRKEIGNDIVVAGVQSIYKKAMKKKFDLLIVDEVHLVPPDGQGMYRSLISNLRELNPNLKMCGLTATPYRTGYGSIVGPDEMFNSLAYEADVADLISDGFLTKLTNRPGGHEADLSGVKTVAGEYNAKELEEAFRGVTDDEVRDMVSRTRDRKRVLVFASGVDHAERIANQIGESARHVHGSMLPMERDSIISSFRDGDIKYLVNCRILTTGFDDPETDCIVLMTATQSLVLYVQMVGRGLRKSDSKQNTMILDYGGNIRRHGPLDSVVVPIKKQKQAGTKAPITKDCPNCGEIVAARALTCSSCGHAFPAPKRQELDSTASALPVMRKGYTDEEHDVTTVNYVEWVKKGASEGHPKTLCVEYWVGIDKVFREWICVEHTGYVREVKARQWWMRRSDWPMPSSAAEAVEIATYGGLRKTNRITVREVDGEKYGQIVNYDLGEMEVPYAEANENMQIAEVVTDDTVDFDDDLPF